MYNIKNQSNMIFSQRRGIRPTNKPIQYESMDSDLLNSIWNAVKIFYIDAMRNPRQYNNVPDLHEFAIRLWHSHFKIPIDTIPSRDFEIESTIRFRFFRFVWYDVYDFIEFLIATDYDRNLRKQFNEFVNEILEKEFSAYRIINGIIAPISNSLELDEVSESLAATSQMTALSGANCHLETSLAFLSDKNNPNYRNSIKESISAVEATCRIITGESTLGSALTKLELSGFKINSQLKQGFDKLYAYTNNKSSGIRHAIVDQQDEPDFSDAKYMLISCSSFINYLVSKAQKIGLTL
jgi:hypothetical protein